jgi:hypothetical protein
MPSGPRKPTSPVHFVLTELLVTSRGTWSRIAWSMPRVLASRTKSTSSSTPNRLRAEALV